MTRGTLQFSLTPNALREATWYDTLNRGMFADRQEAEALARSLSSAQAPTWQYRSVPETQSDDSRKTAERLRGYAPR